MCLTIGNPTFCVRASSKVCRVILLKLKGSDFELSLVKNLRQVPALGMKHLCDPSLLFFNVERSAQERHTREEVDENRLRHKISRANPTLKRRGWVRLMIQNVRYNEGY